MRGRKGRGWGGSGEKGDRRGRDGRTDDQVRSAVRTARRRNSEGAKHELLDLSRKDVEGVARGVFPRESLLSTVRQLSTFSWDYDRGACPSP